MKEHPPSNGSTLPGGSCREAGGRGGGGRLNAADPPRTLQLARRAGMGCVDGSMRPSGTAGWSGAGASTRLRLMPMAAAAGGRDRGGK